jgi:hypothetical protein
MIGISFWEQTASLLALSLVLLSEALQAQVYYVAPNGLATNPGTLDSATTITRAIALAVPGTTISLRGGKYLIKPTISISKSGTAALRISILAYPGEHPVLDGDSMTVSGSNRVINLSGSYWTMKGLEIMQAGDNGMRVTGSYNIIEGCSFHDNSDTGLQLDNGASFNQIINCDSYNNADPSQGNADGFAAKLNVGTGNSFVGCRSWYNSDDGWDGYLRGANGVTTTLDQCWSFANGYLANGSPSTGNGNGFKMGGSDSTNLEHNMILTRCVAFANRVKGFDQNHDKGSMTLLNCTGYLNGTNYSVAEVLDSGKTLTLKNCVCLGTLGSVGSFAIQATNSWLSPFSVTAADFGSVDTAGVRGPRSSDGSLPVVAFMHLASGSDLIDAGTDVGLPYEGPAPDLGAFETSAADGVSGGDGKPPLRFALRAYPNPFNPRTVVSCQLPALSGVEGSVVSDVRLVVYDLLGREVAVLVNEKRGPGEYEATFDGTGLSTGVYICRLTAGEHAGTLKLLLTK